MGRKGKSGYLVVTKTGIKGRTYHDDELVNGKQVVYRGNGVPSRHNNEGKILVEPNSFKVVGFLD